MPMDCGPRFERLAVYIVLFLASASLLISARATVGPGQERASQIGSVPSGLVLVIRDEPEENRPLDLQTVKNPFIQGVALQIHWSDIEPIQGKLDWTKLDALFAAAESSKKWVQLFIFPGFFTPEWALEGVKTDSFEVPYGPYKGQVRKLPMPWDRVYLGRWFAFLKELSDRYGKSPTFRMVAADGPTSVSDEYTLPNGPTDRSKWQDDSYTPSKYLGAWEEVFRVYAADFPNQYVSLSVGGGLPINDRGEHDPHEHLRTKQAIVERAIGVLGRRFALQLNDVHAGPTQLRSDSDAEDQFVIGYIGRIVTGFQMKTTAEHNRGGMGAAGDPPAALRKSINLAMETNTAGQHVDFLQIYEPDVRADEMQPVLQYAASLFRQSRP
jgi:hypothetical protein